MDYSGEGKKKVLIIAEAPGKEEDEEGTQLVGESGQVLRDILEKYDLDLDRDFWKINSINCRPHSGGSNRTPTNKELDYCAPMVINAIKKLKPKVIWLFGKTAVRCLYRKYFSDLSITRWRALCIPDRINKCWVIPLFHPAYLVHNDKDENLKAIFEHDIRYAISQIDRDPPIFDNEEARIRKLTNIDSILDCLDNVLTKQPEYLFFDYETTGLKPYRKGHKIVSISFCTE